MTLKAKKLSVITCSVLMIIACLFGVLNFNKKNVNAESTTTTMIEIAEYVKTNNALSTGYDTANANFKFMYGDISSPDSLSDFTNANDKSIYKYDATNKIDCFFYYSGTDSGLISAGQKGYESVIVVTAKSLIKVTTKHAAFTTTANNLKISTLIKSNGVYTTVQTNNCGGAGVSIAENTYSGTYTLFEGDKLLFVIGSTNTYTIRRNAINPSFVVESVTEQTYNFASIANAFVNGNKADEGGLATVGFRYGTDFDSLNTFTSSSVSEIYKYSGSDSQNTNFFFRYAGNNAGKVNAGANAKSVVQLVANANVNVIVTMPQVVATQNNIIIGMAITNGTNTYTIKSYQVYLRDTVIPAFNESINLQKGQKLFWYVASSNEYYVNSVLANPTFKVSTTSYNVQKNTELFSNSYNLSYQNDYYYSETIRVSGDYTLPEVKTYQGTTSQFIGWSVQGKLYFVGQTVNVNSDLSIKAIYLDINAIDGAAIRIDNPTGIRYGTYLNKARFDLLTSLEGATITTGTLIAPTDYLSGGVAMSFDGLDNATSLASKDNKYLDVVNEGFVNEETAEEDKQYLFYGSIVNILEKNYTRAFSGIGYVKVSVNGQEKVFYAEYDSSLHSRSIYDIAKAAYVDTNEDGSSKYSENQLKTIKGFIDKVVDISADGENVSYAGNIENYDCPYEVTVDNGVYTVTSTAKISKLIVNGSVVSFTKVNDNVITFSLS